MTALLIAIGLIPFFSGRTLLTVGLILSWTVAVGADGNFTFSSALLLILGTALSFGAELAVSKMKPWVREAISATFVLPYHVEVVLPFAIAMLCGAMLIERVEVPGVQFALSLLLLAALAWFHGVLRNRADAVFETLPIAQLPAVKTTLFGAEVVATIAGVALAFVAPIVGAALMVTSLLALGVVALLLRRLRDGARETCVCGASIHQCAVACAKCGAAHAAHRVGFLGRPTKTLIEDENRHRIALLAGHRCPRCADGLSGSRCTACNLDAFRDDAEFDAFVRYVDTRFAVMTPVFIALGFVPVLGLALALVAYRLSSAGAFAGYADWRGRFGVRVLRGVLLVGLALVQPVPLIGVAATWGYLTLSHVWTRAAVKQVTKPRAAEAALVDVAA